MKAFLLLYKGASNAAFNMEKTQTVCMKACSAMRPFGWRRFDFRDVFCLLGSKPAGAGLFNASNSIIDCFSLNGIIYQTYIVVKYKIYFTYLVTNSHQN